MFDLSIGVARAKLLNDKTQGDGYPDHKDRCDFVKKAINMLGSQLWKNAGKRLNEMPMRMLIAQELPSGIELKDKTPGIVAKLMGLNSLPTQHRLSACKRNLQKPHSHHCTALEGWRQEQGNCNQLKCRGDFLFNEKKYKDVYEVKYKSSSFDQANSENIQLEDHHGSLMEKRMALVHQKFLEAKRLATNEKLLQSKEFKDAVEVLNSNRDLFLKLLEDPNCFSSQLQELHQTTDMETQTKSITVLKPTLVDTDHEKGARKNTCACGEVVRDIARHDVNSCFYLPKNENAVQPTKIVVLKASAEMPLNTQAELACHNSLPVPKGRKIGGNLTIDENVSSTEQYIVFAHTNQKDSRTIHNGEYQRSPALCNGYIADESSISMSETDFQEEGVSDCSEFELVTPTSHNSWFHRSDSPGSPSSFSPTSWNLESSVSREAKKRMSKRLESVILNRVTHGQEVFLKSTCTLGEMLAIPEIKKEEAGANRLSMSPFASCDQGHSMSMAPTSSPSGKMHEFNDGCPTDFSKSMPPTSQSKRNTIEHESNVHEPSSKSIQVKKMSKLKNERSFSKVSGLLFSSMKKLVGAKPNFSFSSPHPQLNFDSSSAVKSDKLHKTSLNSISDEIASKTLDGNFFNSLAPILDRRTEKHGNVSLKGTYTVEKLWKYRTHSENSNQAGHTITLERLHQDDFIFDKASLSSQHAVINNPQALSRSPLISSVSRSVKLENTHFESTLSSSFKLSSLFFKEDEELERLKFITKLLSSSSFANESCTALLAKLNSLDSPLNPILLDEFLDGKEEDDDKCRESRSNQKLYFDCVNDILRDICRSVLLTAHPWSTTARRTGERAKSNLTITDAVWRHLKASFSEAKNCSTSKSENSCQYFDTLVRKEVAGIELTESVWFEKDELSNEISEKMLEALFDEALADLIGLFLL